MQCRVHATWTRASVPRSRLVLKLYFVGRRVNRGSLKTKKARKKLKNCKESGNEVTRLSVSERLQKKGVQSEPRPRRTHVVGEYEMYKEERDVLEETRK